MSKLKKAITAILIIAVMCTTTGIQQMSTALAATSGDYEYTDNGDGTCTITGYTGTGGDITIPDTLGGLAVTVVGDTSFYERRDISSVAMPNSVISIGAKAFRQCDNLVSISMSNNIITIGNEAFNSCINLSDIILPNSITSIGDAAFAVCDSLSSITIPESVTNIGHGTFGSCNNLVSIDVNINNCNYLAQDGVLCDKSETILIQYPAGKNDDFYRIPDGITTIREKSFYGCGNLNSVVIPDSVTAIEDYAFMFNDFTSVTIGNSVKTIGEGAFGVTRLTSISIPDSVITLGRVAFTSCYYLNSVIIGDSVISIEDYTFNSCSNLSTVTIGNNVEKIGESAFNMCSSLTAMEIPESVETIERSAFFQCTNLESVIIGNSVTTIGRSAFYYCESLKSVQIGSSVSLIDMQTFYNCLSLESIGLPESLKMIGELAFYNCLNLKSVVIPNGVTSIGDYAFQKCRNLKNITIPSSVISIGVDAFIGTGVVIYGEPDSYAETYANQNGITFCDSAFNQNYLLESGNMAVLITDKDSGLPVIDASVIIEDVGASNTNANGLVTFEVPYSHDIPLDKRIQITKEGYLSVTRMITVEKGTLKTEYINKDEGKPCVLDFIDADNGHDMLNEQWAFHNLEETDSLYTTYQLIGAFPGSSAKEYRLIQDGEIKMRNETGFFSIDFSKDFKSGYKIYVQVVNATGEPSEKVETGIFIYNEGFLPDENDKSISFGKKISLPIPDNIPLVGGKQIEFGFLSEILPFTIEIDENNKVKATIGSKSNYDEQRKDFAILTAGYTQYGETDVDGLKSALEAGYGGGFGKPLKAYVIGVGEGYYKDGTLYINWDVLVKLKGHTQYTMYTFPFYATFKLGTDCTVLQGGVKFQWDKLSGVSFDFGYLETHPSVYGSIGVGAGIPKVASAELEGKCEFGYYHRWRDKYNRLDLTLTAKGAAYGFFIKLAEIDFLEETYVIKEWYGDHENTTENIQDGTVNSLNSLLEIPENVQFIPRVSNPMSRTVPDVISYLDGTSNTIEANTYQNGMPKMITHNGTPYVFWVSDDPERPERDRAMLVYSKYENGIWSSPIAIQDDDTADGYFSVQSDQAGIYVAWHDSKNAFWEGITAQEIVALGEVSFAYIETLTGNITVQEITSNGYMDTLPKLSITNGNGIITWLSNNMNSMLMNEGENTVYQASITSGIVGDPVVVFNTNDAISNIDAGVVNGNHVIAVVLDADNNFETIQDTEIYIKYGDTNFENFSNNSVSDTGPYFAKRNGTDCMFWYSDTCIYSTSDFAALNDIVLDESEFEQATDCFELISNDEGTLTRLIWIQPIELEGEVVTAVYASDYLNGWSDPYELCILGKGCTLPSGFIDVNSELCYLKKNGEAIDLVVESVEAVKDIQILDINYGSITQGTQLDISVGVQNTGMQDISEIELQIVRNGSQIYSETISVSLPIGTFDVITTTGFIAPSDIVLDDEYKACLVVDGDANTGNNENTFKMGYPDLTLNVEKMFDNGDELAIITIENSSEFASDAIITVKENNDSGIVIHENAISDVNSQNNYLVILDVNSLWDATEESVLMIQVSSDVGDYCVGDNYVYIVKNDSLEGDSSFKAIEASYIRTNCSSLFASDGSILIEALFGSGNYLFSHDRGETWSENSQINNLADGVYEIWIKDSEDETNTYTVTVYLLRADYNDDMEIDMLDLVIASQAYNSANRYIDLNADEKVNLFDLILIAKSIT